jgi:hypothetical protein
MGYLSLFSLCIYLLTPSPVSPRKGLALTLSAGSLDWYTGTSAGVLCDKAGPYALSGCVSQAAMPALGFVDSSSYYIIGGFWSSEFNARFSRNRDEVVVSSLKPGAFRLYRNHPNPFRYRTLIAYDLPLRSRVYLRIYDSDGRQVRELANGWQDAGRYRLNWDGRDKTGRTCPSGVYFCSLKTKDSDAVQKMLIAE